jgi:hypothetical protein
MPGGVDHSVDRADDLDRALARALPAAVDAGRLDVVAMLAEELRARRLARDQPVRLALGEVQDRPD